MGVRCLQGGGLGLFVFCEKNCKKANFSVELALILAALVAYMFLFKAGGQCETGRLRMFEERLRK